MEEKKETRGRKKGVKSTPVAAFAHDTIEFIGIYNSPYHAAKVLWDRPEAGQRIKHCAEGMVERVKDRTFVYVDLSSGFTAETIEEATERAKKRKTLKKIDRKSVV